VGPRWFSASDGTDVVEVAAAVEKRRRAEHPLLDGARGHFDEVRSGNQKVYVVPRKSKLVDVFVTPGTLVRALELASELFLFLEARGQRVVFAAPAGRYRDADGWGALSASFGERETESG
jgi:hypothetical protein